MKCCIFRFIAAILLGLAPLLANAQEVTVFSISEPRAFTADDGLADYYFENGDYTSFGKLIWNSGQESIPLRDGTIGFPYRLNNNLEEIRIYFQLGSLEADSDAELKLDLSFRTTRIVEEQSSRHDLEYILNGTSIGTSENVTTSPQDISVAIPDSGARTGENQLIIRRTGFTTPWPQTGPDAPEDPTFSFLQLRDLSLRSDISALTCSDPICYFAAESSSVLMPGTPVELRWLASPTTTLEIDNGVGSVTSSAANGYGSVAVLPQETTTYTLTATEAGTTTQRSTTIGVGLLQSFTTNRTGPYIASEGATLSWQANPAATITIAPDIGDVSDRSFFKVSPSAPTTYTLTATLDGATDTSTVVLTPGILLSFAANPTFVNVQGPNPNERTTTFRWRADPAANFVLTPGIGDISGIVRDEFTTFPFAITPDATTTYTLTATLNGVTESRSLTVRTADSTPLWTIGTDNGDQSEFEIERPEMSQFYLDAGDYSTLGGNSSATAEPLTDGGRGDPGFPRALTTTYPEINVFFQLTPEDVSRGDEYEIIADMVLPRSFDGVTSTHDITFAINGETIGTATGITTEVLVLRFSKAATSLSAGANILTITRTGAPVPWPTTGPNAPTSSPTVGWIQFDFLTLGAVNPIPQLPFQITSILPGFNEVVVTWVSEEDATYTIESSADLATWDQEDTGYPTGGATGPRTSYIYRPSSTPALPEKRYFRIRRR